MSGASRASITEERNMSIEVTDELVGKIAVLSRLNLTPEEIAGLKEHFEKVLEYVGELQELDTDGVDPSLFTTETSNVLRPDEGAPSLDNETALRPAPESEPPYFLVPRIVEDAESSES